MIYNKVPALLVSAVSVPLGVPNIHNNQESE